MAGMGSPDYGLEGIGFPDGRCDGYASPLRADNVTDFKSNITYPKKVSDGKVDCPDDWKHVPAFVLGSLLELLYSTAVGRQTLAGNPLSSEMGTRRDFHFMRTAWMVGTRSFCSILSILIMQEPKEWTSAMGYSMG